MVELQSNRSQIGGGVVFTVLQLAKRAVMIMKPHWPSDFRTHMRGGHIFSARIGVGHLALAEADGVHARAEVHAPNSLGTEFTDVEFQLRRLEVAPPFGQKVFQVFAVAGHVILIEHIVLTLMPHETLKAVFDFALVQIGQCGTDGFQCQGIHLETDGLIRIPVTTQVCASGRNLDDGDGRLDVSADLAREAQFRPYHIIDVLQCYPAIGAHLVLATDAVGKEDVFLWGLQSDVGREALDVLYLGIRSHHV